VGVWSRDAHELFQVPRAIQAGRVWVNQYNTYPAHALLVVLKNLIVKTINGIRSLSCCKKHVNLLRQRTGWILLIRI
jgi:hypothetical protein